MLAVGQAGQGRVDAEPAEALEPSDPAAAQEQALRAARAEETEVSPDDEATAWERRQWREA